MADRRPSPISVVRVKMYVGDWMRETFEKYVHKRRVEEDEQPHSPTVDKWLRLADQMFSAD